MNLDELADKFVGVDQVIIESAHDLQKGKITLEEFKSSISSTSSSTSKFGAALKSMAANMAITLGITLALKAAFWAFDQIVHRQENLNAKASESAQKFEDLKNEVDSLNSELGNTNKKIDELEAKPNLTFVEQDELQNLKDTNEELERSIKLLEAQKNVAGNQAREDTIKALKNKSGYKSYEGWRSPDISDYTYERQRMELSSSQWITPIETAEKQLEDYNRYISQKEALDKKLAEMESTDPIGYMYDQQYTTIKAGSDQLQKWISALETDLTESSNILDNFKKSLDPEKDADFINSINTYQDLFSETFGNKAKTATDSFDALWNSDNFASTRKKLEDLSTAGELTPDVLESNEEYKKLLDATGRTAEQVASQIKAVVEQEQKQKGLEAASVPESILGIISILDKIEDKMKSVGDVYKEFMDNGTKNFSNESLMKVIDEFGEVNGVNVQKFVDVLTDSASTANQVQEAFNDLASEYINSTKILDTVTESNKDYIASKLREIGITNSVALVEAELTVQRNESRLATIAQSHATYGELSALRDEIATTDEAKIAINQYYLEKLTANGISLSTTGDIQNIMSLVSACGSGIAALKAFYEAKQGLQSSFKNTLSQYNPMASTPIGQEQARNNFETEFANYKKNEDELIKKAEAEINDALNKKYSVDANYGGNASNSGGKSGGGGGSGSKSGAAKTAKEVYDWIETLIKRTNEKIEKLQKKATDAKGWRAKNELHDTVLDELQNKIHETQLEYERYMQEANDVGLSDAYINKIQNGLIDIEKLDETEENEVIRDKIKEYTEWYEKARQCANELDAINDEIRETNELKLDEIINDYDQIIGLMKSYTNYQKDLIEVRDRMGETPEQSDYQSLIYDQQEIYSQLTEKYNELDRELNSGGIEKGTKKWYEMREELIGIKSEMIDCANAVEDFKDEIFELRFKPLEDLIEKLDSANSELSNMVSLIGDDVLVKNGMLTDRGLSAVGLYARQLINAKQEAEEYKNAIKALNVSYENGDITLEEYNKKLYDYRGAQQDAALATKEARDAIIALREEAIDQEIDAMNELIQSKIALLDKEEELYEYQKKIANDNRNIASLEKQIQVLSLSSDRADKAQKLKLERELADARTELEEYQREHSVETQKDALEEEGDAYEKAKNEEKETLRTNLEAQEALIRQYLEQVKNNYSTVYGVITDYADNYNMDVTEDLTNPFSSAEEASQSFQDAFSDMVSQIQYEIDSIDWSNMTSGLDDLGGGSGDGNDWEDVTGQGKWTKDKHGWWYGSSNDDYVSDGYYTIKGKTYNFNEDGYMKSGWDDSQGEWYYFEPENGEMVKSTWRKDKKGDWYYLQSDGSMATDAAVKARNGDGYYILDSDGKWDGKTVSKKEVEELGYDIAYKSGTRSGRKSVALTDEDGIGSEVIITRNGALRQIDSGDHVFNARQVENLWRMSNNNNISELWDTFSDLLNDRIPESIHGENSIIVNNSVNVEGDASEKTVGLINMALNDFAENRMANEFNRQLRYKMR